MKSKTSQDFIASESNGVKRDQELKQKQLKKGKGSDLFECAPKKGSSPEKVTLLINSDE